jgi:hypothetical protein
MIQNKKYSVRREKIIKKGFGAVICILLIVSMVQVSGDSTPQQITSQDKPSSLNPQVVTLDIAKYSLGGFQVIVENHWGSTLNDVTLGYSIAGGLLLQGDAWSATFPTIENTQQRSLQVCFWPPNQTGPICPMGVGSIHINAYVEIPGFDTIYESRNAFLVFVIVILL